MNTLYNKLSIWIFNKKINHQQKKFRNQLDKIQTDCISTIEKTKKEIAQLIANTEK